jgi:Cu(I)/Ag(I) efflux system protein CusF
MNTRELLMMLGLALTTAQVTQADDMASTQVEAMKMEESATKAPVNRTKGLVKELDTKKGTVTLSHDAVPTLKWPAMTMTFQISPELAKGIEVGQKVDFEFEAKGMAGTITKISPIR